MDNRARLLTRIFDVELEEFFEGNCCPSSIAPNLDPHPGLAFFYERLKSIRRRSDVKSVLVYIYDLTDIILNALDGWPGSECVHVLTSAKPDEVQSWATDLLSDGTAPEWFYGRAKVVEDPPEGFLWWTMSWD